MLLAALPITVKSEVTTRSEASSNTMTPDEALVILEAVLQPKSLSDLQQTVFCRAWIGQSYEEIAEELTYDPGYIRDVGSHLWAALSKGLGEKVTKKNVQVVLRHYQQEQMARRSLTAHSETITNTPFQPPSLPGSTPSRLEFPSGVVALNSPLYVERPPIEAQTFREIHKSGSLIRIKAPCQMGKSSLLHRILAYARQNGVQTAMLNLQRCDRSVLSHPDQFLRWLCANIAQQLDRVPNLDDYWNLEIGSKMSCTLYFQRYLLPAVDALVLGLDEVNRLFEYPDLAADFLPLLRSWYEDASEFEIWQKLRLIVVHDTEAYIPLNINQSPFNVGLPINLPEFTPAQVQTLALQHGLTEEASSDNVNRLLTMIGGHPYRVRLALYHLAQQEMTLAQLLQNAPTSTGIYATHLRQQLAHLHNQPELAIALRQVLSGTAHLEAMTLYKLESLGLIKIQGNTVSLSCELYQIYFHEQLKD